MIHSDNKHEKEPFLGKNQKKLLFTHIKFDLSMAKLSINSNLNIELRGKFLSEEEKMKIRSA